MIVSALNISNHTTSNYRVFAKLCENEKSPCFLLVENKK